MFRTLRSRLAAMAAGITLAVSIVVCTALYFGMRISLYQQIDEFLAGEVMEFQTILTASRGDLDEVQSRVREELGSRRNRDLAFRLVQPDGTLILTSEPGTAHPHHVATAVAAAGPAFFTENLHGVSRHRICSQPTLGPSGQPWIMQAAYVLDQADRSLMRFLRRCIIAVVSAAVLSALGGWFLAVRGLRPLRTMAAAARKIRVGNLETRLARTGSEDELDRLAETFNDLLERLQHHVSQLRQFTADAAHELRTPLAALRGSAEVALSAVRSNDELRAVLADSIEEFDRLARIADDLLLLARADSGQEFLRRADFRLDTAVRDVTDLYSALADDKGIQLRLDPPPPLPCFGDEGRLRQMLANLLDNALKFTPAGGAVSVSAELVDSWIQIVVRDSGNGIDPAELDHIFDRFYRVDRARTRGASGAGLGLSICRTIVQAHGGQIRLDSAHGQGTTVTVRLPREPAIRPAAPAALPA